MSAKAGRLRHGPPLSSSRSRAGNAAPLAETTADDVEGWDSSSHINMLLAAEERFGVRMTSAEIEKLTSIGALVQLIRSKSLKL